MPYINRISNLRKKFADTLDAVLITNTSNITYFTGYSNFSDIEREAYLFITKKHEYLITDGRYSEAAEKHIPHVKILERNAKQSLPDILKRLCEEEKVGKVGLEYSTLTIAEERSWVMEVFPQNWDFNVSELRTIKETTEIDAIEKACKIGDQAFEYILGKIKSKMTEKQIAWELELFIKQRGVDLSFPSIVAIGPNSSIPHHQTNNESQVTNNCIVLLDFGVKIDNYCSDMTRTVHLGKANAQFKKMYITVLESQRKSIEYLSNYSSSERKRVEKLHKESSRLHSNNKKKGLTSLDQDAKLAESAQSIHASDIDRVGRQYIMDHGFSTIPHSLGHGIGLQVHEAPHLSPVSDENLEEGMVFSVEPGIYIPKFGGVRIEDLVVLEKSGPRLLTHAKKELIEID